MDDGQDLGYEPRRWHRLFFLAFNDLRYDRFYGAMGGRMPMQYTAISAFARDHGITGRNFTVFKYVLHLLDGVYLEMEAQRDKAAKEGGEHE